MAGGQRSVPFGLRAASANRDRFEKIGARVFLDVAYDFWDRTSHACLCRCIEGCPDTGLPKSGAPLSKAFRTVSDDHLVMVPGPSRRNAEPCCSTRSTYRCRCSWLI